VAAPDTGIVLAGGVDRSARAAGACGWHRGDLAWIGHRGGVMIQPAEGEAAFRGLEGVTKTAGSFVSGMFGWQEEIAPSATGLWPVDPRRAALPDWLGVWGPWAVVFHGLDRYHQDRQTAGRRNRGRLCRRRRDRIDGGPIGQEPWCPHCGHCGGQANCARVVETSASMLALATAHRIS